MPTLSEIGGLVMRMLGENQEEQQILNAVRRDGFKKSGLGSERYIPEDLPDQAPKNLELSEKNLLESVCRDEGITSKHQKSTDIDEYHSAEANWNRRLMERKKDQKTEPKHEKTEADEVLAAVTRDNLL